VQLGFDVVDVGGVGEGEGVGFLAHHLERHGGEGAQADAVAVAKEGGEVRREARRGLTLEHIWDSEERLKQRALFGGSA
jgi:hypothetical protein